MLQFAKMGKKFVEEPRLNWVYLLAVDSKYNDSMVKKYTFALCRNILVVQENTLPR